MTKSLWLQYSDTTDFPRLSSDLIVDVVIIGGGITGVTTAQLLSREGLSVALLEKDRVGLSSTGNSTGNLYEAMSEILNDVHSKFGDDVTGMVIEARRDAIDLVEENVNLLGIDCDFRRVGWTYYTTSEAEVGKVAQAQKTAAKLKLDLREPQFSELPFSVKKGFSLDGAAQFNPLRYVQGLARAIEGENCRIFENSEVREIREKSSGIRVTTKQGHSIEAKYCVHATHTPKGIMTFHTELGPYREFGVACQVSEAFPDGVFFGHFGSKDIVSIRNYVRGEDRYLIFVGQPFKVGHADPLAHLQKLEAFARAHFTVSEITHRWAAQNYKAADYLPYIGPKSSGSRVFVACGLSSHGLTYGTVAAQVIAELIADKDTPFAEIFKPSRFTPIKSAPKFIKENVDVVLQFVKDYALKKNPMTFDSVKAGEGQVVERDGHKLAVHRTETEGLQICSAVCTHLGCVVHWNNAEKSWDCPCHGSRFAPSGAVLEGPALKALASLAELTGEAGISELNQRHTSSPEHHLMDEDELVDEASLESFPASDPPGGRSRQNLEPDERPND